jgi:hypothetical protein
VVKIDYDMRCGSVQLHEVCRRLCDVMKWEILS